MCVYTENDGLGELIPAVGFWLSWTSGKEYEEHTEHLLMTRSDKIMVYVPSSSNSLSLVSQVHNLGFLEVILDISQFKWIPQ